MKKHFNKLWLGLGLVLMTLPSLAQDAEMADQMRSNGKIYVIVGIILIVLCGLIGYLFIMDRKVKKLEDRLTEAENTRK